MKTDSAKKWEEKAEVYSLTASSKEADALEYEVNFPSILKLCPKSSTKVLDLGCGSGEFTEILHNEFKNAEGWDVSPTMIKIAQSKYPQISFEVQDLEEKFNKKDQ